jgi:hypothetical protein
MIHRKRRVKSGWGANLSAANLSGSILKPNYFEAAIWTDAFYCTDNEPTWHSVMDAAWRSSVGILALAPPSTVPEPTTLLLALLALVAAPLRVRCG